MWGWMGVRWGLRGGVRVVLRWDGMEVGVEHWDSRMGGGFGGVLGVRRRDRCRCRSKRQMGGWDEGFGAGEEFERGGIW